MTRKVLGMFALLGALQVACAWIKASDPYVCDNGNTGCTCFNPTYHMGCVDNWVDDLMPDAPPVPSPVFMAKSPTASDVCTYPTKHMGCADHVIRDLKKKEIVRRPQS